MSTSWIIDYKDIILCRPGSRMSSKVSIQCKKQYMINILFSESWILHKMQRLLGYFRVPSGLCIKTRLSANAAQANESHFHKKGCALGLILRVRVFGTRKRPIKKSFLFNEISDFTTNCFFNLVCNLPRQLTVHMAFKPRYEIECFSNI